MLDNGTISNMNQANIVQSLVLSSKNKQFFFLSHALLFGVFHHDYGKRSFFLVKYQPLLA